MKTCVRPMPVTGLFAGGSKTDRIALRGNDALRCLCGKPTCRDVDWKKK